MTTTAFSSRNATAARRTERLNKTVRFYRLMLRLGVAFMVAWFVQALLRQLPRPSPSGLASYVLLKGALVMYMYCWFFGSNRDLSLQNDVLRDAPSPTAKELAIAVGVLGGFAFLFYVDSPAVMARAFLAFLALNVLGWVYLKHLVRPYATDAAARALMESDRIAGVKLKLYEDYLFGRWQSTRFVVGFGLLVLLALLAFDLVPFPGIPKDFAFACGAAGTILVLEAWIWYRRVKLIIQWEGLNWLEAEGLLTPSNTSSLSDAPAPPEAV